MRYPDGHKENVSARIVVATSRALRQEGIDAVSIPRLMKLAGLTHGGFYSHFKDRDDLIAKAAVHAAYASVLHGDQPSGKSLDKYLTKEHVLHPEVGCVVAALGAEGARQKGSVRRVFAEIGRGFLRLVDRNLHPEASAKGRLSDEALATASRIVGAIMLARLVDDETLAERILTAAKTSR
ncbi:MAG TPA: TetR/AcrR family transcriptional regulator [Polyangia bacterium]|nr:TetR/AcrR family transcriptional regulator [Polyangia bacterium]